MPTASDLLAHPIVVRAAEHLDVAGIAAWLVGGGVRDAALGRPLHDIDIAVAGDGLTIARRLARHLDGAFVALDEERRVGRIVLRDADHPLYLDIATLRGSDGADIEADLWLRDFTMNAIGLSLADGTLLDPTGGIADIAARQVRAVNDGVFHDDPLRMLRGLRQAGQLGFAVVPETLAQMRRDAPLITRPAAERVRDELMALLAPAGAAARVRQLDDLGLLAPLLPEIVTGKGVTQSLPHTFDVFEHNLAVLDAIENVIAPFPGGREPEGNTPTLWQPGDPLVPWRDEIASHLAEHIAHEQPRGLLLKLTALLHDVGKPRTRTVGDDGRIHFYRHDEVGARMAEKILQRLKFPGRSVGHVTRIIAAHLRPLHLSQKLPASRRALYRFFRDTGDVGPDVALLSIADQRGKLFAEDRAAVIAVVQQVLGAYFEEREALVTVTPLLSGHEVMEVGGLAPGPRVGQILERLREAQALGQVRHRGEATALVRKLTRS